MEVKPGDEVIIDTLTWLDGWEFGHPSMIISPVIQCHEDGAYHERLVEHLCLGLCCGAVMSDDFEASWGWRGYRLPYLKKIFKESLKGKKFPEKRYSAKRTLVRFYEHPKDGLLRNEWDEQKKEWV